MVTRNALKKGSKNLEEIRKKIIDDTTKDDKKENPFYEWFAKIASLGENGLNWLFKNLWFIVLVITFLLLQ